MLKTANDLCKPLCIVYSGQTHEDIATQTQLYKNQ